MTPFPGTRASPLSGSLAADPELAALADGCFVAHLDVAHQGVRRAFAHVVHGRADGLLLPFEDRFHPTFSLVLALARELREAGIPVVFGNAMEERTLRRARDLFRVPRVFVAVERVDTGLASELIKSKQAEVAFEGPHDLERWGVRTRRDEVVIQHRVFRPPPAREEGSAGAREGRPGGGERFAILVLQRDGKTHPMCMSLEPREGDLAAIAVYLPDREEADRLLGELGWHLVREGESSGET